VSLSSPLPSSVFAAVPSVTVLAPFASFSRSFFAAAALMVAATRHVPAPASVQMGLSFLVLLTVASLSRATASVSVGASGSVVGAAVGCGAGGGVGAVVMVGAVVVVGALGGVVGGDGFGGAGAFCWILAWIQLSIVSVRVKNPGIAVEQLAAPKLVSPISTHV
jgi:hypothetical protein